MDEYIQANRDHWNEITPINAASELYDLGAFKTGKRGLHSIEVDEVGDVAGKSLLHLQCHFGMDTLSWARLGARVTGVDFSDEAVELAQSLSEEIGIDARFILCNVYDLPSILHEQFDIVFTSYGVITWLPDLARWGRVVARYIKPGGVFYIAEFHPFAYVFYDEQDATELRVHYPYFHAGEPLRFEPGSYANPGAKVVHPSYDWTHSLGDVVNALIDAGLSIEFLHEFPYSVYRQLPFMEKGSDGLWRLPPQHGEVPLMFSIMAIKPEE